MTNELQKRSEKLEKIRNSLEKHGIDFQEGDMFVDDDGRERKVGKITQKEIETLSFDGEKWRHYGTYNYEEFKNKDFIKITKPIEEIEKEIFEKLLKGEEQEPEKEISDERQLMQFDKNYLLNMQKGLEEKRQNFELMHRILERKRHELREIVSSFELKIKQVQKVLGVIELYLGINEEIIQIQEGENAPINEPINLRQQIVFMDEEIGITASDEEDYQGLDFQEIKKFDTWITTNKRYEKVIPEKKGIVILRVRRNDKDYGTGNGWAEMKINFENKRTYILIRNGENVFRIWADIIIHPRLFPKKEEFQDLIFNVKGELSERQKKEREQDEFRHFVGHSDREHAKDRIFDYHQNIVMLQGLIDRTPIFQPLPLKINLFDPETWGEMINFIYDDELALPPNRMMYEDWKKEINSKITRGTRVYFKVPYYSYRKDFWTSRKPYQYRNGWESPESGIYSIIRLEEGGKYERGEKLVCNFNPKDTVYKRDWTSSERKKAIPFYIYKSDEFILNYDLMTLDDVEYYIHSRIERDNYLDMLPVLCRIKVARLEELKWERGFVENLTLRLKCDSKTVWEAIDWWKHKVIWKRPITKEDAKALRMIEWKVKKMMEEK